MGRRAWLRLAAASVRSRTGSATAMVLRVLSGLTFAATESIGIVLLVDRFGGLVGWSAPEVLILYGLGLAGQGLGEVFYNQLTPNAFSAMVREGSFDQVLTRPAPSLGWLLAASVDPRYLARFAAGVGLLVWAADGAGLRWDPAAVGVAALAVCCCAALLTSVFTLGAALTLRTVEGSDAIYSFTFGSLYLTSFPMEIYGSVLRLLFTWVLPFALAVYVPALFLLGRAGPPGLPGWLLVVTPVMTLLTCTAALAGWRAGVRAYLGAGS